MDTTAQSSSTAHDTPRLLRELAAHLRRNRTRLRAQWVKRIFDAKLLTSMSRREIISEATSVYDNYVEVLETGSEAALRAYARDLSRRIIPRGVETHEVLEIVLLLRDVLARSLFLKYRDDFTLLDRVLDAYEPAANRIAKTVGASFVELRERVIRRHEKSIQVLRVQEKERRRISRELHDEVGNALTAIRMNLAVLQRNGSAEDSALLKRRIGDMEGLVAEAMAVVHNLARDLRPAMLDELGLVPALRSYLSRYTERTGLEVQFSCTNQVEHLGTEAKTVLFRVAEEGLTNVAKHAAASRVELNLQGEGNRVLMEVKDNGRGFAPELERAGGTKRLGLVGMQERVRLVGGSLTIASGPGRGTALKVQIPTAGGEPDLPIPTISGS